MSGLARVVWSEGMHLAQHHFQAQSRYFEELVSHTMSSLFYKPYGLTSVGLDAAALLNGTAALIHARGVLPDGLVFNLPEDGLPHSLDVRDLFSPTQDRHLLLLGIPAFQPTRPNTAEPSQNGADARFVATQHPILDETTGEDEKKVGIARKNLRLVLDNGVDPDLVTIPIARIRRDGSGNFVYDPDYIPPTLRVGGSPRLVELLSRLVEILESKAEALAAERGSGSVGERGSGEIASFWLSHAVHASLGPLRHHLQSGELSPEELYVELARLAGALCTFSLTSDSRSVPAYDHDRLDECFGALDRHIRSHLDVVVPTNCVSVRLQKSDANLYAGNILDKRCFDRARWYLSVRTSGPAADAIAKVPRLVKVCSANHIVKLVQRGHPGLTLEHVQVPPSEIPQRAGAQYFEIVRGTATGVHPCWTWIVESGQVGVYVPDAIPDVELDLAVVLDA